MPARRPAGLRFVRGPAVRGRGVLLLAAALYVVGLSAVLAWTSGLRRRGVADARGARDWYLLAALVGLPVAPLLAFTLLSALR